MAVFVCHSSADRDIAEHVAKYLEHHGVQCWIAPRDIPGSEDWSINIVRAIESASALVLIYSAHAVESPHVRRELGIAVDRSRPIYPLRLQEVQPGNLEFLLTGIQWIEWVERRDQTLDSLAIQLKRDGAAASPTGQPGAAGGNPPPTSKLPGVGAAQQQQPQSGEPARVDSPKSPRFSCTLTLAVGVAMAVVAGGTFAFLSDSQDPDVSSTGPSESITASPGVSVTATKAPDSPAVTVLATPAVTATMPPATASASRWPAPAGFAFFDCSTAGNLANSATRNGWRVCWSEFTGASFAGAVAEAVAAGGFVEGDYEVAEDSGGVQTMTCVHWVGPSSAQVLYVECKNSSGQDNGTVQMSYLG